MEFKTFDVYNIKDTHFIFSHTNRMKTLYCILPTALSMTFFDDKINHTFADSKYRMYKKSKKNVVGVILLCMNNTDFP